ncbi:Imm50 family immunity protein [Streptomyces sp. NPDC059781]|uniref:Imm50 family immunity protein n=1 Tax=Streptomyces sp. NPDC059781 TaxID=3346943 RepID=UPI00364F89CC
MTFHRFLVNSEVLHSLYGDIPAPRGVRIRSLNLNWRGPTVTLRLDLPHFPAHAPQDWIDAKMDTVQCQLQFLAVENISLTEWAPPVVADIAATPLRDRRIRVKVADDGMALSFDSSDSVLVGHVSAFCLQPDGSDSGRHLFTSKIDARRHESLPRTDEKTFYERF